MGICFICLGEGLLRISVSKEPARSAEHLNLIPGLRRFPGEGNGNPLQYSCLENPMDFLAGLHSALRIGHDLATKPPPPG